MDDGQQGDERAGDLLARARLQWVRRMAAGVAVLGYPDYRRTDPAMVRLLRRGPLPVGRTAAVLGVSRQAARKVVDGLVQRGFAATTRDRADTRVLLVSLTEPGEAYARAVLSVMDDLERDLRRRVDADQLAAAVAVLRVLAEPPAG